jgi:hypothetical protein
LRLITGEGRLVRPADEDNALTTEQLSSAPSPERPPGFYGPAEAPLALNVIDADTPHKALSLPGVATAGFIAEPPVRIAPSLFAAALLLLLADGLITLLISGKLMSGKFRSRAGVATSILTIALSALPNDSIAQPLDPAISQPTIDATLSTQLAFVETGDPATDRLSSQGLAALSRELIRRTSVEPAPPAGISLETDDLSVFPFLYWPIVQGAEPPSEAALANLENFMRFGGLVMFDTRDDERAVSGAATPERQALRNILSQLDIPPLEPVNDQHVLSRSFYLLDDLQGRMRNNPVWVQSADTGSANDGVTPIIIGGRDWAGAWATDNFGQPVRPMSRGGERARELAYRAGVNVVMVALTGNYKSDQVHTPILLERLGQ